MLQLPLLHSQGSAIACCEAMFSHNIDCVSSSLDPGSDGQWIESSGLAEDPWYPRNDLGYCVKDGNEAQHFTPDEYKFVSMILQPSLCCCRVAFFMTIMIDICLLSFFDLIELGGSML